MTNQNQEQPITPEITPEQKPKPKPKLPNWASILIIVIAAVIVVGLVTWAGYELFKPSPSKLPEGGDVEDEFKDWKTYQNEEYGWEVRYPGDLAYKETRKTTYWLGIREGTKPLYFWPEKELQYSEEPTPIFTIKMSKLNNKSFEEWIRDDLGFRISINLKDGLNEMKWDYKDVSINNKKWLEIDEPAHGIASIHHYISFDGTLIDVLVFRPEDLNNTLNQILSTFKFIEPEISANWKTYQNEEYGWEIQYPGDMLTKAVINRVLGEGKEFLVLDIGTKEYINRLDAEYGPGKGLCGEGFSFSVHLIACKSGVYRRDDFVGTMYKDYKRSGTIDINGTSVPKYEGSLQMFDTPVLGMYFDFLNKDNSMAYLIQAEFCSSQSKILIEKIVKTFKFVD